MTGRTETAPVEQVDSAEYEWCWIACPHDPPCADAPPSSDPRDE